MTRALRYSTALCIAVLIVAVSALGATANKEKVVIAHRGASGYLPEHTLEAAAMAYAMGADYIEVDLMLTRDGVPIVLHDLHLDATTNVRDVFPDRRRADGKWYAIDFALAEIKSLKANERRARAYGDTAVFPGRFPVGRSDFEVPTFVEIIELVQGLNKSTGRNVGIYPELKAPAFHRQHGYDLEKVVLETLHAYGYQGQNAKAFVQSFEADSLKRLRFEFGTELPLVQLIGGGREYDHMVSLEGLKEIATYAKGIGPSVSRIVDSRGVPVDNLFLVREAHALGLVVHAYTLRKDQLPGYVGSFEDLLRRFYFEFNVDGVFTDHPDAAVAFLRTAGY